MKPCTWVCLLTALLLAVTTAEAGQKKIELKDHLNRTWMRELVTYTVEFPKGACHPKSVRLRGPGGPVACQLADVESWPDGKTVKRATLAFVADMKPLAKHVYTMTYGPTPAETRRPRSDLVIGAIRFTRGRAQCQIDTKHAGLKFTPTVRVYDKPVAASDIPGPIDAMRLGKSPWFGGSRLYGPAKIKGYRAALTAKGPAFAEIVTRYDYVDGRALEITIRLAAGDSRISWAVNVTPCDRKEAVRQVLMPGFAEGDRMAKKRIPPDGWQLLLSPKMPGLEIAWAPEAYNNKWKDEVVKLHQHVRSSVQVKLDKQPAGPLTALAPWADWWDGTTKIQYVFSTTEGGKFFHLRAQNAGCWVEPGPIGRRACWGNVRQRLKWVWIAKSTDGAVGLDCNLASGRREWTIDSLRSGIDKFDRSLNEVKEQIVEWPVDPKLAHPRLYVGPKDVAAVRKRSPGDEALIKRYGGNYREFCKSVHSCDANSLILYMLSGTKEMAKKTRVAERLRKVMDLMGDYDRMRQVVLVVGIYDAIMGTDLITEGEKKEFRAKMAYLGYLIDDAATWSMERGYASGNPNMSVCHVLNLGLIACVLRDHPMSETWVQRPLKCLEGWLDRNVGPEGEWPESVCNYAHVSVAAILPFAIAAKNAGYADYVNDPRMKKLMLYLAKFYTPRDTRSGGQRKAGISGCAPLGRAGAGNVWALAGVMARATKDSDPAYSAVQQWSWRQTGYTRYTEGKMGGFAYLYCDPSLPAKVPDWQFDVFPERGTIMRNGVGTKDEFYAIFMVDHSMGVPSGNGGFPCIWARGVPISSRFAGGYAEREAILYSNVLPARNAGTIAERCKRFSYDGRRKMLECSGLPRQHYAAADIAYEETYETKPMRGHNLQKDVPVWPAVKKEAKLPVHWRRQVLFMRDAQPAGANYMLIRDKTSGGQPTMWQFWTISDKIGTPEEVKDLDKFLADKPGNKNAATRQLKGNRFTAIGQFGVDVEFYVALPTDTPRHTLRWGPPKYTYSPIGGFEEYQDMLHLQLPGDGEYFTAIYPRRRNEPAPHFSTLCQGKVIKVAGDFGTDYGFLSSTSSACKGKDFAFEGTAGSIQDRKSGLVISIAAAGKAAYKQHSIASDQAVSLVVEKEMLKVRLQDKHVGAFVEMHTPGTWTIDTGIGSVLRKKGDRYFLHIRPDVKELELFRE